jgi:hypothetical protein
MRRTLIEKNIYIKKKKRRKLTRKGESVIKRRDMKSFIIINERKKRLSASFGWLYLSRTSFICHLSCHLISSWRRCGDVSASFLFIFFSFVLFSFHFLLHSLVLSLSFYKTFRRLILVAVNFAFFSF